MKTEYPYEEDQLDNTYFASAFPDAENPDELYRQVYKYTECGAYLSVQIAYYKTIEPDGFNDYPFDKLVTEWIHCDGLARLGSWKNLDEQGILIIGMMVGSIVEGVDYGTDNIEIDAKQLDEEPLEFRKRFDNALAEVESQANNIWNDTHGCKTCADFFGIDLNDASSPVWTECPDCHGHGSWI